MSWVAAVAYSCYAEAALAGDYAQRIKAPINCANCGAPDEGYTACSYCKTRMRMGAEEASERLRAAKASVVDDSQPEWSKALRESMVTAMVMPELVNAIQTGAPTPLSDAFSSGGSGDFGGGGASGEF